MIELFYFLSVDAEESETGGGASAQTFIETLDVPRETESPFLYPKELIRERPIPKWKWDWGSQNKSFYYNGHQ